MDRICAFCGKKIEGHANKKYCSKAHKRAAYLSRKKQEEVTVKQTIKRSELVDLNFVGNHSPDAKMKLISLHARYGKDAFLAALDACYVAVVDVVTIQE